MFLLVSLLVLVAAVSLIVYLVTRDDDDDDGNGTGDGSGQAVAVVEDYMQAFRAFDFQAIRKTVCDEMRPDYEEEPPDGTESSLKDYEIGEQHTDGDKILVTVLARVESSTGSVEEETVEVVVVKEDGEYKVCGFEDSARSDEPTETAT